MAGAEWMFELEHGFALLRPGNSYNLSMKKLKSQTDATTPLYTTIPTLCTKPSIEHVPK